LKFHFADLSLKPGAFTAAAAVDDADGRYRARFPALQAAQTR
jgi:hypothetical protein